MNELFKQILESIENGEDKSLEIDLQTKEGNEKINNILGLLDKQVQTFITTTDISQVDQKILENSKKIKVETGSLREE